ncbi:MAG: ZIP family metal transporter [Acholeplasmatales bacterium]|nr:ZIP family metal transporter [Acholeplasmatales bacterium]
MVFLAIILPFLGTLIGSMLSFTLNDKMNSKIEKILLGFAAGVMVAASIWSLLNPAIEHSEYLGKLSFLPAAIGFIIGIGMFLLIDFYDSKKSTNINQMYLAVTLHNIPEGMAVGVVIASAVYGDVNLTMSSAIALSIGIAIQNIPEGAIISMPLRASGMSRFKSFLYGALSGIVEPIFCIITILLIRYINPLLPYFLSFAAGAMVYVVIDELIPESQKNSKSLGVISFSLGFLVMMILDVMLG